MRKLKLLFELVFIFILPLIFMCFYLNIETVYTYDSDGNYQDSSKQITFDTIEIVNEVSNVHHGVEYVYYTQDEFNLLDQTVYTNFRFNPYDVSFLNNSFVSYNGVSNSSQSAYYIQLGNVFNYIYCGSQPIFFQKSLTDPYFVGSYYSSNPVGITYLFVPNFWIKEVVEVTENHYKNPLYDGLVKIEDMVGINTNSVIVEFINTYNCLWILMFAFWHLLYAFFELMVHIFDPKKYRIE